ncbi:PREDICTED: uncharacterized protein LOC105449448 [Wasmannia auropunctata]|uniref:uncharacterized protein LOC105449448 n=1 Tax=Wasmannia auropunctata TaxID=64793 RepID=UPI0005EE87FE|nr:PREDICTED: uncharacterized protein LOC105449448 [Wasmannia auropunctata]
MGSNRYLTNKKTGEQAQKRWDSLRCMWSRQHKKYYEQGRSGSGASQDTQEFQYYGEMSFLIPHYSSRQTKSNIKRPVSCISNDGSSGSQVVINKNKPLHTVMDSPCIVIRDTNFDTTQFDSSRQTNSNIKRPISCISNDESSGSQVVNKPLPTVMDNPCCTVIRDTNFDTAEFDTDVSQCISLDSDDSLLQQSSQEKNEMHIEDRVPFSPMAQTVLNNIPSKQPLCCSNKTGTKEKYKQKENSNIKVPEPDEFCKKKKVDIDNYMRSSVQSLEKMAQSVGDMISRKAEQKVNVSDNDNIDKDISDMLKCAYVGLKQVKSNIRFECILEILKVINRYKDQD